MEIRNAERDPANRCQACGTKVGAVPKLVVARVPGRTGRWTASIAGAVIVSATACGALPKTTPTCKPKAAQPSANGDRTAYSIATLQEHELGLKYRALCLDCAAKSQIFGNDHRERCIM